MAFEEYKKFKAIHSYLNSDKREVTHAVVDVVNLVVSLANQTIKYLKKNRLNVTDKADYLNNIIGGSQVDEIREIAKIQSELDRLYDETVMEYQFGEIGTVFEKKYGKQCQELKEENIRLKTAINSLKLEIEQNIKFGVTSKFFFDSAISKAKNQIERLDCKRFVKLTINKFQDEFSQMKQSKDIQGVVSILHEILIAVRGFHTIKDKHGKKKIIVHQFSGGCQADLSMFLSMYNSELIDYVTEHEELPTAGDEYRRILGIITDDPESLVKKQYQRLSNGKFRKSRTLGGM